MTSSSSTHQKASPAEHGLVVTIIERRVDGVLHCNDGPALQLSDGTEKWCRQGKLHREGDLPAVVNSNGMTEWWLNGQRYSVAGRGDQLGDRLGNKSKTERRWGYDKNGKFICHRTDGPAVVRSDGTQKWFEHGKIHRADGPAVIHRDGSYAYCQQGKHHREDGPAVVHSNGTEEWRQKGLLHREDGPALIHLDGYKEWRLNGVLHRENGPAIEMADGRKQWYVNGRRGKPKSTLLRGGSGGFNINSENTYVYLINHDEYGIQKIGISGDLPSRLSKHHDSGFEVDKPQDLVGPLHGTRSKAIETAILSYTRRLREESGITTLYPTLDGKTECWPMRDLTASSILELLAEANCLDLLGEGKLCTALAA